MNISKLKVRLDRETAIFLIAVFAISYAIEFAIIDRYYHADYWTANILIAVLVFVPSLVASILINIYGRGDLSYYGVEIGNLRYAPLAYFYPLAIVIAAASLVYLLGFEVDWALTAFRRELAFKAMASGLNPNAYLIYFILGASLAPIFNIIFTVGEEVGWRGFLLTKMLEQNSLGVTIIFIGIVWALWHAPLIVLIGYNYPVLRAWGLILFSIFCIAHGTILIWFRLRSNGIILPSLGHGALNASWWLATALLSTENNLMHLIVGIPGILIVSIIAFVAYRSMKNNFLLAKNLVESELRRIQEDLRVVSAQ